ncbi:uncharacterized protein TNCV_829721 [Trichonephila clavipes]|nr:uncharacterized protein TNCV_829721 [Trichonephila clavipes]
MCNYAEVIQNQEFRALATIFDEKLVELENKNKTSKLWITYFRMVTILKNFIAADGMGDCNLHLHSIEIMIPLFHASGCFPYAKASQIYLQDMKELHDKMNSSEFKIFSEGYFTSGPSDVFCSGIASDQTIEQTLMKGMSVEGGPFKRGATENVVYKWIRGVIYSQDIIEGIENFCNISFNKSHLVIRQMLD